MMRKTREAGRRRRTTRRKTEAHGAVAGKIAHDLNNILLPILINAELALSDEDPDGPQARRLQQIVEAAKRGRDLVKQVISSAQERDMDSSPLGVYGSSATRLQGAESILFIDDEEIQVRAMQKLLEHLGYRVLALADARAALEAFRASPEAFDLVITDMSMPTMSGSDFARQALKIKPGVPIILCTGYSESIDESRALAQGVRAFMMKPYSVRDIAKTIRSVLEARSDVPALKKT